MSVEYLDLADYIAIAAAVTGLDLKTVMNMTNHDLADSALHARSLEPALNGTPDRAISGAS